MNRKPAIEVSRVEKTFGSTRALAGVDLELRPGEVHGIIGENGAGKSTLLKVLSGVIAADRGEVRIHGEPAALRGVHDAQKRGVVMIHQELNLVDELSAAGNIFLHREPTRWGLLDRRAMARRARQGLEQVGCSADPDEPVGRLSIADRQLVEIATALGTGASIVLMDEPTAVLTANEVAALFRLIGQLRSRGVAIVYVSHLLSEVLEICDRITVMRDGAVAARLEAPVREAVSERDLAALMVGRPMAEHYPAIAPVAEPVRLEVKQLACAARVEPVSFSVRRGEIFGLAGLIGAGRTRLAETIAGLGRRSGGAVWIDGAPAKIESLPDAVAQGIAYVPEDRKSTGLALEMSVSANVTMVSLARYSRGLIRLAEERRAAAGYVDRLRIRAARLDAPVSSLSGGNQQKVLLAKWLDIHPRVLILDEPTRGVDIGAKEEIYRLIQQLAANGMACVMISSEINELLGMCHRIGVMRQGRLVRILDAANATEQRIMQSAAWVGGG